jgi:hypothetical protein
LTDEEWFCRCNHLAQQAAAAGDKDDDIVAALLQSYLSVTPTTAPAVVSERAILAKEIVFGARLLHAVAGSSQSSDFTFAHTAVGTWPPERLPTLSRWYRVAAMAKAYPAHCAQLAPLPTLLSRAQAIARECGEVLDNKVSLWLYGGPGHVVYHLIDTLSRRHGWSIAQVDARLEVTLVNLDTTVHNYNKWSIPCADHPQFPDGRPRKERNVVDNRTIFPEPPSWRQRVGQRNQHCRLFARIKTNLMAFHTRDILRARF